MSTSDDTNPEDLFEELAALPTSHLIQRQAPSKRSAINEYQVRLLVRVARKLSTAALLAYGVRDPAQLPRAKFEQFIELPEYELFIDTCYAAGFVCRDLAPKADLDQINQNTVGHIQTWSLPQLRLYLHTLVRAERWTEGSSSHIFNALQAGTLLSITERLENDDHLYAAD